MENPDQNTSDAGSDNSKPEDKSSAEGKAKAPKAKATTAAKSEKPASGAQAGGEPAPAKGGRICKEPVRWKGREYGIGKKLPAEVPAETIARLEELGFV